MLGHAHEAGVKTYQWQNLKVMVWYPAKPSARTAFDYYGFIKGQAVYQAEKDLTGAPYPLIVFSHGLGMCAYQSVFLMESLAKEGFIVIAPDHKDAALCHIGGGSDLTYQEMVNALLQGAGNFDRTVTALFPQQINYIKDPVYRPEEIRVVLTSFLVDSEWSGLIDFFRIGGLGHSFGGWTMEALAGAEIDCHVPADYGPEVCSAPSQKLSTAQMQKQLCCLPKYQGKIFNFYDSRIKAIAVLAPGSFIFPHYGALKINVPVMFVAGDHFEVDWNTNLQLPYNLTVSPKYLVRMRGADHLTASDLMSEYFGAKLFLSGYWFYPCKQGLYKKDLFAFFRAYLEDDQNLLEQLLSHPCFCQQVWYKK